MGDIDTHLKFVFIGAPNSGKTALFNRMSLDKFQPENNFMCSDYAFSIINYDAKKIKIVYWDTVSQQKFTSNPPKYYKDANAIFLCCDTCLNDRKTLLEWLAQTEKYVDQNTFIAIVGCKSDKRTSKEETQYQKIAKKYNYEYYETSSWNGDKVKDLFEIALDSCLHQIYYKTTKTMKTTKTIIKSSRIKLSSKVSSENSLKKSQTQSSAIIQSQKGSNSKKVMKNVFAQNNSQSSFSQSGSGTQKSFSDSQNSNTKSLSKVSQSLKSDQQITSEQSNSKSSLTQSNSSNSVSESQLSKSESSSKKSSSKQSSSGQSKSSQQSFSSSQQSQSSKQSSKSSFSSNKSRDLPYPQSDSD